MMFGLRLLIQLEKSKIPSFKHTAKKNTLSMVTVTGVRSRSNSLVAALSSAATSRRNRSDRDLSLEVSNASSEHSVSAVSGLAPEEISSMAHSRNLTTSSNVASDVFGRCLPPWKGLQN